MVVSMRIFSSFFELLIDMMLIVLVSVGNDETLVIYAG